MLNRDLMVLGCTNKSPWNSVHHDLTTATTDKYISPINTQTRRFTFTKHIDYLP